MPVICPTCQLTAGKSDRFCRGCYTVLCSKVSPSSTAVGKLPPFRGTAIAVTFLAAVTYWFSQLEPAPWLYEPGSPSAIAAGLKRDVTASLGPPVRSWSEKIVGTVSSSEARRANESHGSGTDAAARVFARMGSTRELPGFEWHLSDKAAVPCPKQKECDAVLRFPSGDTANVVIRHVGYHVLRLEPKEEADVQLLANGFRAIIVRTAVSEDPLDIPIQVNPHARSGA